MLFTLQVFQENRHFAANWFEPYILNMRPSGYCSDYALHAVNPYGLASKCVHYGSHRTNMLFQGLFWIAALSFYLSLTRAVITLMLQQVNNLHGIELHQAVGTNLYASEFISFPSVTKWLESNISNRTRHSGSNPTDGCEAMWAVYPGPTKSRRWSKWFLTCFFSFQSCQQSNFGNYIFTIHLLLIS